MAGQIIRGLEEADYHADRLPAPEPTLSSTIAKLLVNETPMHAAAKHPLLDPNWRREEKTAYDIGSAMHTLTLGRGAGVAVVDAAAWTTKAAKQERDTAREAGLTPMLRHQYDEASRAVERVRERLSAAGHGEVFNTPGNAEVVAFAPYEGVWNRCMVDYVGADGYLWDLKTTESARIEDLRRTIPRFGYHMQACHYLQTWRAAGGEAKGFRFVFVEKSYPHDVAIVELSNDGPVASPEWEAMGFYDLAQEQLTEARRLWRQGLDTGRWPGSPAAVVTLDAPAWMTDAWMDRRAIIDASRPAAAPEPAASAKDAWRRFQAPA